MKKLRYAIVILLVVLLLTPWLVGLYFKHQYLNLITAINQTNTRINVLEYRTGWLNSKAKVSIELFVSKNMPPVELMIDQAITHGPIMHDNINHQFIIGWGMVKSLLHLPEPFILGTQKSNGVLQTTSIFTFNNNWIIQIYMPAINTTLPTGEKISWEGLTGSSKIKINHSQLNAMHSTVTFGAFSGTTGTFSNTTQAPENRQLTIQPISLSYDAIANPIGFWTSSFRLSIPHFSLNNSGKNISLTNFTINSKNTITDNIFYNSNKQFTLERLEMPGNVISFISPANLNVTINNLNAKGLIELYNYVKDNQSIFLDNKQLAGQTLGFLTKIILPTSIVASNVFANTSLGAITATTKAFFAANTPAFTSMEDLIKNINLQINIRIAASLANKLIEYYYQFHDLPPSGVSTTTASIQAASVEIFNDKIAALMKEGKLSLPLSLQIMTLNNQSRTLDEFNAGLIKLNLPPSLTTQLVQIYSEVLTLHQTQQQPPAPLLPTDKMNILITEWFKQGFLIQDKNDYVVSITRTNGELKINEKNILWQIPLDSQLTPAI